MIDVWKIRRAEPRILLALPVTVEGEDTSHNHFLEETNTENVSKNGACLLIKHSLAIGTIVTISAWQGKFRCQAIVRGIWIDDHDKKTRLGIRFIEPVENWVVT
jgi:PilZ domain-containing protein